MGRSVDTVNPMTSVSPNTGEKQAKDPTSNLICKAKSNDNAAGARHEKDPEAW